MVNRTDSQSLKMVMFCRKLVTGLCSSDFACPHTELTPDCSRASCVMFFFCVCVCVYKLWQTGPDRLVTVCLPRMHLGAVHITAIYFMLIKLGTHCWPFGPSLCVLLCASLQTGTDVFGLPPSPARPPLTSLCFCSLPQILASIQLSS